MIKKTLLPLILSLAAGAAFVVQVCAKDSFDDAKFRDLLMERAESNEGMLELNFDIIKDLLGKAGMAEKDLKELSPERLIEFFSKGGKGFDLMPGIMSLSDDDIDALEKQYIDLVDGHKPATRDAAKSTVAFYQGDNLVVMGTVIDRDGYVLTKASDFKATDGNVTCDTGKGKRVAAKLIEEFDEHDLALVKIERKNLTPVKWYEGSLPEIGAFLAAPAPENEEPLGIGVLSVLPRSLSDQDRAFLGVGLERVDKGVRVTQLIPDTAAAKAGLRQGDIITALDGESYSSVPDFINAVGKRTPGDSIKITTFRAEKENSYEIELGRRPTFERPREERFERMNNMGTRLSDRREGYPQALQHDIPIEPEMVGGPLVDLDGNVLGINIARAGRVKTYAIPAEAIRELVSTMNLKPQPVAEATPEKNAERVTLEAALHAAKKRAAAAKAEARKAQLDVEKAEARLKSYSK